MENLYVEGKGISLLRANFVNMKGKDVPEYVEGATGVALEFSDAMEKIMEQDEDLFQMFTKTEMNVEIAYALETFRTDLNYVLADVEGMNPHEINLDIALEYWLVDNDTAIAEIDAEYLEPQLVEIGVQKEEAWEKICFICDLLSAHLANNCHRLVKAMNKSLNK